MDDWELVYYVIHCSFQAHLYKYMVVLYGSQIDLGVLSLHQLSFAGLLDFTRVL